jgi:type I restriction enzyme S subunit
MYAKYRDSGEEWLGQVPEHWKAMPLKSVATVDNSGCYGEEADDDSGDALPVATTAQISANGRFDAARMPRRTFTFDQRARYGCRVDDVLVVKSSGSATNIISGKAGLIEDTTPFFIFSNFLMRLAPRRSHIRGKFLYSLLLSNLTRERVRRMVSTTTYPNLQVGEYIGALLPIPAIEEQDLILLFLDQETAKIDALIEEQRRLIELLKEKRQAVISHVVTKGLDSSVPLKKTGIDSLGYIPAHWSIAALKHLASKITDGAHVSPQTENGVYAFVSTVNLTNDGIDFANALLTSADSYAALVRYGCHPLPGDILFSKDGSIGKIVRIAEEIDFVVASSLVIIRTNQAVVRPAYLELVCKSDVVQKQVEEASKGAGLPRLSIVNLCRVIVCYPPIQEQEEILREVEFQLRSSRALEEAANDTLSLLRERRSALISAAVTGKIDVRNYKPHPSAVAEEIFESA